MKSFDSFASSWAGAEELDIVAAIQAHVNWKIRLQSYIDGTSEESLEATKIRLDDQCALGKWIYGPGGAKYGDSTLFEELRKTHGAFHQCAAAIVQEVDKGNRVEALKMLNEGDYAKNSYRVKTQLARLFRVRMHDT